MTSQTDGQVGSEGLVSLKGVQRVVVGEMEKVGYLLSRTKPNPCYQSLLCIIDQDHHSLVNLVLLVD